MRRNDINIYMRKFCRGRRVVLGGHWVCDEDRHTVIRRGSCGKILHTDSAQTDYVVIQFDSYGLPVSIHTDWIATEEEVNDVVGL